MRSCLLLEILLFFIDFCHPFSYIVPSSPNQKRDTNLCCDTRKFHQLFFFWPSKEEASPAWIHPKAIENCPITSSASPAQKQFPKTKKKQFSKTKKKTIPKNKGIIDTRSQLVEEAMRENINLFNLLPTWCPSIKNEMKRFFLRDWRLFWNEFMLLLFYYILYFKRIFFNSSKNVNPWSKITKSSLKMKKVFVSLAITLIPIINYRIFFWFGVYCLFNMID